RREHERFFRELLGEVEEPTAPFGVLDIQGDGRGIEQVRRELGEELSRRVRERARRLGVSAASVYHAAWGMVLAAVTGQRRVVFGTVLLGRMQSVGRGLGLYMNALPLKLEVGETGAEASVRSTQ